MNKKQALEYLKNIDRSDASIKSNKNAKKIEFSPFLGKIMGCGVRMTNWVLDTAAFFSYYKHEARDIAQFFLNEISNSDSGSRKILLIYIIHEIILLTLERGDEFIKAFGDQLKAIVDQIR